MTTMQIVGNGKLTHNRFLLGQIELDDLVPHNEEMITNFVQISSRDGHRYKPTKILGIILIAEEAKQKLLKVLPNYEEEFDITFLKAGEIGLFKTLESGWVTYHKVGYAVLTSKENPKIRLLVDFQRTNGAGLPRVLRFTETGSGHFKRDRSFSIGFKTQLIKKFE